MPKGIFIGIGGTGVTTVARLKALLFQRAYGSNKAEMDADCTFIFYDTDSGAKNKALADAELKRMMGGYPVIDEGNEYVDAGSTAPYNIYMNALATASEPGSQRLLEWAIAPNVQGHFQLPQKQLSEGAGAQRMAGRTGIFNCHDKMEKRIWTGLNGMSNLAKQGANMEVEHPAIWVFSSSNGGTSSSALLDVLYMADRLYKAHVADVNPYLRLVLYMPKAFIDANSENAITYGRNAYATMWELNEFRFDAYERNDGNKFGSFAVMPDKTDWKGKTPWSVCSYVMGVDTESQSGSVSLDQMYANTAELCYFLHTGAAGKTMISNIDNDLSNNGPYAHSLKTSTDDPFQWTKFIVGSGYKAITKADDFMKEYVRSRIHYDLFGYGLLGLPMEKILRTPEERMAAAEKFTTEYITKHLANISKLDSSPKDSLYNRYKAEFDNVMIPSESEVPSKEEWAEMGSIFIGNCKEVVQKLQNRFNDPTQSGSKVWTLGEIEKSVMEGVDKNIIDFGLNYTYTLLTLVDDDYCEKIILGKLKQKNNLADIETEINDIIANNRPKKGIGDLVAKMTEYRNSCLKELAIEHIRTIIASITKEKEGLLEYIRKGNMSHKGISGLMETVNSALGTYKKQYQELASTFKKTEQEVCSDYFPQVHKFVETGDIWVRNNIFETKYSTILPLDTTDGAEVFESTNYGCPPMRKVGDKGLACMLGEIKARIPNRALLYADMVLSNPQTQFTAIYSEFIKHLNKYIESLFSATNDVKTWLEQPLSTVFDEYFSKDGDIDKSQRQQYNTKFTASVPVFYPCSTGASPDVTERWIYVGASKDFAQTLGFKDDAPEKQYVPDNSIGNRFLVCKIEIGHNFYDYKYFKTVKNYYESEKRAIENEGSGCHIHKDFVRRNIETPFEQRKQKKFSDFISLCWYDSFFESLNEMQDKTYIETFFGRPMALPNMPNPGNAMSGIPFPNGAMPAMPGQQPAMPGMPGQQPAMPGMPGQQPIMPGMPGQQPAIPGMPGQQPAMPGMSGQQPAMPGMPGQQPAMPGMPGQQPAMPGMPGQQPAMPGMPGQQPAMPLMPGQMPNMQATAMNPDIENGYKPFVSINNIGQLKIKFDRLVVYNNILGFARNNSHELSFANSYSFTDIWRNIINYDEVYYIEDYVTLISQIFKNLSYNKKNEFQQLFYSQSYIYNNNGNFYGEVWNRFIKKIEPLTQFYGGTNTDEAVWYQMITTIYTLLSKNIFY